jgi:hypothetical protein
MKRKDSAKIAASGGISTPSPNRGWRNSHRFDGDEVLADDQADVLEALCLLLEHAGHDVVTATSPAGVIRAVESQETLPAGTACLRTAGPG